jgi:hypothetical protein
MCESGIMIQQDEKKKRKIEREKKYLKALTIITRSYFFLLLFSRSLYHLVVFSLLVTSSKAIENKQTLL